MAHILAVQQQQLRVAGRDVQHRVELNLKVQVWFTSKQQRRHQVSLRKKTVARCRFWDLGL